MGLGYIGLPTAIIAAKHGVNVLGVDINSGVVEMTNQGKLHIIEPGMEEYLQEVVNAGLLKASTTPEISDAYFMVVPTPFKGNHEPDISYVEAQPFRSSLFEGRRFICNRIDLSGGNDGKDAKSDFFRTAGVERQNIYCLLSGAGVAGECHLRTGS